jgi:two-component system NtrC family sensor kinase
VSGGAPIDLQQELIEAFLRLAKGDFSVRLARNFRRDTADTLAYFVNLIAEELERLLADRERDHRALEAAVATLTEHFLAFAAGDFSVRVARNFTSDPIDVLAYLFNNTVSEVGDAFAEIQRQREVVEAILESMIDGVLLLDAGATIRRANGAAGRLLGVAPEDLERRPLAAILAPTEQGFAERLIAEVSDQPLRGRETLFVAAGGELVSLTVNMSPQRDGAGQVIGAVLVARDDRELRQVQAQLQMMDRLATMGTVAAGVAHEINNPLAFVLANLEFVDEELAPGRALDGEALDDLRGAVRDTRAGAERMRDIVRELKAYARSDAAAATRLDVSRLADASIRMVRNEVRHRARLVTRHAPAPLVSANEGRLIQVVINLLQNAAHAIPPGRVSDNEIRLATGTTGAGEAFIEVTDTGCGIPPDNLGRIFDAFFTTKKGVGTGLGLAICQQIIRAAGGVIEVESAVGAGSRFRVVLPPARPGAVAVPAPRPAPAVAERGAPGRLLVVDDEQDVGHSVRRLLRDREVDIATSGAQALGLLAEHEYEVVLCDVHMPEMTGPQLYQRVSASRPELARRFVFMTGGELGSGGREEIERIARPLLEKPFAAESLRAAVAGVARGEAGRPARGEPL